MEAFDRPLQPVVGSAAKLLSDTLDLHTVGDLLAHYPRRYEGHGELTPLRALRLGEQVTVQARVAEVKAIGDDSHRRGSYRRGSQRRVKHRLEVIVTDGSGRLRLTFFNQPWRARDLVEGRVGMFAGRVEDFRGVRELRHPDYELSGDGAEAAQEFANRLIPIYPTGGKLRSWQIARSMRLALDGPGEPDDPLPAQVRLRHGLISLRDALEGIHRPTDHAQVAAAKRRLTFDEAFLLQAGLARRRLATRAATASPRRPRQDGLLAAFDAHCPFTLTDGQRVVGATLANELDAPHPMHRLLQGEVGSGKTVVALRAMLTVVDAGGQAALLAPTEVLAQQHVRSLAALLGPMACAGELGAADPATRIALLTGSQAAAARRDTLAAVADGTAGIVVGTHALLEAGVEFDDLGLVVVDEQHRFGVEQRDALRAKGRAGAPHVLVMTATPIPRTVAMTVFGDLEVSTLSELPAGRSPIATNLVPGSEKPAWLERAWARLREEVSAGHQAYVICPRIGDPEPGQPGSAGGDDDDSGDPYDRDPDLPDPDLPGAGGPDPDLPGAGGPDRDMAAADAAGAPARRPLALLDVLPQLTAGPLAGLRVGSLHGRMSADAKDDTMRAFAAGTLDVLVATTVVEVGVDVANATVMVILDADRFGVSQLHQLRGRVGRGTAPGLALLVTDGPADSPARRRLEKVAATLDGFALARLDLETRREGDVLGEAQSGRRSSLRLLSVLRDEKVIAAAREDAFAVLDGDPDLQAHPALAAALERSLDRARAGYLEKA